MNLTESPSSRKHYALRFICPHGDGDQWMILQDRAEPLLQVMESSWDFDCPLHGVQNGLPLEAIERPAEPSRQAPQLKAPLRAIKRYPKESRFSKSLRVWVRGLDRNGHTFTQSAYSVNVSRTGARLHGVGTVTRPGATLELRRLWRKARFRVIWTGQLGTPSATDVGICCLEPEKNFWMVSGAARSR